MPFCVTIFGVNNAKMADFDKIFYVLCDRHFTMHGVIQRVLRSLITLISICIYACSVYVFVPLSINARIGFFSFSSSALTVESVKTTLANERAYKNTS